jgi:hypothetical protein
VHIVARGALIGGAVGAAWAFLRPSEPEAGTAGRYLKSIAEGALAGSAVGALLDRRLRSRASALVVAHGPELAETVVDIATEVLGAARPRLAELADLARERANQLTAAG